MMEFLREAFDTLRDVEGLIAWGGLTLVCVIVFVETGLLFGFFLPGDSLLVTAGVFAATPPDHPVHLNLWLLLLLPTLCAIAGDQVGYTIGHRAGRALYRREESFFFRKRHLRYTEEFYEKYGAKTIVLARFVPIVRTFAPVVAGMGNMRYQRFVRYNVAGGALWVWSMVLVGYALPPLMEALIPGFDVAKHIEKVIVVVIVLSLLPGVYHFLAERRRARAAAPRD